jgi:hypothetical protein
MTTILICPKCLCPYALGLTGTVNGCDDCEGIERNPVDHTIIYPITEVVEDILADLERE